MALFFENLSTEYLTVDAYRGLSGTFPITMACWFNPASFVGNETLMFVGDKDATNQYHTLEMSGPIAGDPLRFGSAGGGTSRFAQATAGPNGVSGWYHAAGACYSATSRAVWFNGGSKGTNVNNVSPSGFDRTAIGTRGTSAPGSNMDGAIAMATFWSVGLADAEIVHLARGALPWTVRPQFIFGMYLHPDIQFLKDLSWPMGSTYTMSKTNTPYWIGSNPPALMKNIRAAQSYDSSVIAFVPSAPTGGGEMTTNTGYWGPPV